jgi:hypothetical protein
MARLMRSRPLRYALAGVSIAAGLIVSCSAVVDPDKSKLGAVPIPCEPGATAACPCRDGSTSTQLCNDHARYDRCACGAAAGRAGGAAGGVGGSSVPPIAGR